MPPLVYSLIRLRAAQVRPFRARPSAPPPHRRTYSRVRPCITVKSHRVGANSPSSRLPRTPSSAPALEPARCVLHTRLALRSTVCPGTDYIMRKPDKTSRTRAFVLIGGSTSPRNLEWPSKFEPAQACPKIESVTAPAPIDGSNENEKEQDIPSRRSIRRSRSARRLRGAGLKWTKYLSSQECENMGLEARGQAEALLVHRGSVIRAELPPV
ncbi:hypothetical protein FB451DRAFT_1301244 [Mycena latifolia]|nr:hypothetical protein FB451DRAFT_1301244 [Mycena latifolia]